jgi:radical SAM protein with 4Fe4S-binding SPASM domain
LTKASKIYKINKLYRFFKVPFKISGRGQKVDKRVKVQSFASLSHPLYFDSGSFSKEEKREFFKNRLEHIEIETHGYCNRKCEFCPNSLVGRMDKSQILPEDVFNRIINELSDIEFQGIIKLHRYNEPLALNLIFDRIAYARKKLPQAMLAFHTNGDYVTFDILRQCEQKGLDFLFIRCYIDYKVHESKLRDVAKQQCVEYLRKHKLKAKYLKKAGENLVNYKIPMKKMGVFLSVPDLINYVGDRGGALKELSGKEIRTSPCVSPFKQMFIDWTGDVLPCCNLRSDIQSHKNYILGNVKNSPLQDIFFSDTSSKVRKMLAGFGEKTGPCTYCSR